MCVVLGVGVISVFDAVAFLACMHRVSSPVKPIDALMYKLAKYFSVDKVGNDNGTIGEHGGFM